MSSSLDSTRVLKGGIVLINPITSAIVRVIPFQFNPETLTRTLQAKSTHGSGDRREALRLTGPPEETISFDAEMDATDYLEFLDKKSISTESGIQPRLAALETIIYPKSAHIRRNNLLAQLGTLEIIPTEAPLTIFIWGKRVLPVQLTEFSITEEEFDPMLNPIRAKVSLGMRVLNVNDLPFHHRGNSLYMAYHQDKEALADKSHGGILNTLAIPKSL